MNYHLHRRKQQLAAAAAAIAFRFVACRRDIALLILCALFSVGVSALAHEVGKNDCSCDECRLACEHKPGWFHPDEIAPLAKALDLTIEQLFEQHLSVDWWAGDDLTAGRDIFVLSPRLASDTGGKMFPANPHGTCHWFESGKCQIHLKGKPAECAFAHHNVSDIEFLRHRLSIVKAWALQQALIAKQLGKEPYSEPYTG